MLQTMLKKWWLILLQGILMIILSIFIFNNPVAVLAGISVWFGVIVLLVGISGVIGWMVASKEERESVSLIWSILTALFGLLMLMNIFATMKAVTIIFGIWLLVTGYHILNAGWLRRQNGWIGWLMVIIGILSMIAGLMMIMNIGTCAVGVSTLLGFQVMLTGIALVLLAFVKKTVVNKVEELKSRLGQ